MKKGRLRRNKSAIIVFFLILILGVYFDVNVSYLKNYTDTMNGLLSLSGFATAVLFAAYSLIPQFPEILKSLNTPDKFRDRLLVTTMLFSIICGLSLVGLAIFSGKEQDLASVIFMSVLLAFIGSALEEMRTIFKFMLRL